MKVILSFLVPILLMFSFLQATNQYPTEFNIDRVFVMLENIRSDSTNIVSELTSVIKSFGQLNKDMFGSFSVSQYVDSGDDVIGQILNYIKGFFVMCYEFCTDLVPYAIESASIFIDIVIKIGQLILNEIEFILQFLNVIFSFIVPA